MIMDLIPLPPVGGFLDTLMYSAGERRDGFTRTVGFEPSPAAQQQSMDLLLKEMDAAKIDRGVVVGRLAGVLGSVSNDDFRSATNSAWVRPTTTPTKLTDETSVSNEGK